jgi:DNA-binding MarR family transcriptional regulator
MGTTTAPGATALAAWRCFLTFHARVTEVLERELQDGAAMPLSWYDLLVQLTEAPGRRLRMHDLASRVLLSRAGLTRLVDRMAAAGLVERVPCPDDRRGTFVALTAAGEAANLAAAPFHLAGIDTHFAAGLSPAEAETLQTVFERLLARLPSAR